MNNITINPERTLTVLAEGKNPRGFIADRFLAPVPSDTLTGYFGRVNGSYLNIVDTATKGNGQKNFTNYKMDRNANFEVGDHELSDLITAAEAEKAGGWDAAKRKINTLLAIQMKVAEEYSVANYVTTAGNLTAGTYDALTDGDRFDVSGSELLLKVKYAKDQVAGNIGNEANTGVIGRNVFSALQTHEQIYSVLGKAYKGDIGLVQENQMAIALGIDEVMVARAFHNSANENQDFSLEWTWGNNMIIYYKADSSIAEMDPGLGGRVTCPKNIPTMSVGSYVPEGKEANQAQVLKHRKGYVNTFINMEAMYEYMTCVG